MVSALWLATLGMPFAFRLICDRQVTDRDGGWPDSGSGAMLSYLRAGLGIDCVV